MALSSRFPLLLSVLLLGWAGAGDVAAQLLPIFGVTASASEATPWPDDSSSALVGNVNIAEGPGSVELGDSYSLATSTTPVSSPGDPLFNSGTVLTFDLGAIYNVSDLLIWNFSQNTFQSTGAKDVQILTSVTGTPGTFLPVIGPGAGGSFTFNEAPSPTSNGYYTVPAQVVSVDVPLARYVHLNVLDIWAGSGQPYFGLNEVNFVGTEVVPEPSTYAMLGLGLLALIGIRRFRQLSA